MAFVRSLEIIGEAVKQIPLKIKEKYEKIEWRNIAGMRDKLTHHYFGIDYFLVWDIVKNYIPKLKESISIIIDKEFKNNKTNFVIKELQIHLLKYCFNIHPLNEGEKTNQFDIVYNFL
jgi:hypothetical protein